LSQRFFFTDSGVKLSMLVRTLTLVFMSVLCLGAGIAKAGGDIKAGEKLSIICVDCHGDKGLGDGDIPAIAGLSEANILKQLSDFKSGARIDEYESMVETAADLSEQEIADLAVYYSTLAGQ
jgi:cytochrome c553